MQNKFLAWLDPDPHLARVKLDGICQMLRRKFGSRWYLSGEDVEDLVQETLERVMQNVESGFEIHGLVPERFIHGVANNVLKEKLDEKKRKSERQKDFLEAGQIPDHEENLEERILTEIEQAQYLKCLEKCIAKKLSPLERNLVRLYSMSDSHYTKDILGLFGGSPNKLRVRIYRLIKFKLKPCLEKCLDRQR
jgi:RNA polymerase sigma factor (sigma-70 family)